MCRPSLPLIVDELVPKTDRVLCARPWEALDRCARPGTGTALRGQRSGHPQSAPPAAAGAPGLARPLRGPSSQSKCRVNLLGWPLQNLPCATSGGAHSSGAESRRFISKSQTRGLGSPGSSEWREKTVPGSPKRAARRPPDFHPLGCPRSTSGQAYPWLCPHRRNSEAGTLQTLRHIPC